jgi:F0F1-type ATP synthase assembly protein I
MQNKSSNDDNRNDSAWLALWREALVAMSLGWDLAVPIFGGALGGYFLDRWLNTGNIFTMGLIFFGIAVSYYNLGKFIRRQDTKAKEFEEEKKKEKK